MDAGYKTPVASSGPDIRTVAHDPTVTSATLSGDVVTTAMLTRTRVAPVSKAATDLARYRARLASWGG